MENPGFGNAGTDWKSWEIQDLTFLGKISNWNILTIQGIYEIMVGNGNRNIVISKYTEFGKVYISE